MYIYIYIYTYIGAARVRAYGQSTDAEPGFRRARLKRIPNSKGRNS